MKTDHTQTPWDYCYDGSSDWSIGPKADPQGDQVATIWDRNDPQAQANAKFIVKACNNHKALVEALKIALPYVKHTHSNLTCLTKNPIEEDLNKINAVLKAVEVER